MIASSTAKIHGHYDFFTGLITLDKFTENDLPLIESALIKSPPPTNTPDAISLRDIRALIKHEVTHFLDHLTTIWGIEFLYRRSRLVESLMHVGADVQQPLGVYLLNATELQMHADLVKVHKDIAFDECDVVRHQLVRSKLYGPIIIVKFFQNDVLVCDVPLSMLSLLEANALANEYLSRFDDLIHMDQEARVIAEKAVERRLHKILNEPDLAEYSVLIRLAKIHFTFFDSRQLLSYMSILVNFCLNASISSLGTITENIRHSFENKNIGDGIWADLCRGMSRHVIAFKTIMFMYNWIHTSLPEKSKNLVRLMVSDPYDAIELFWDEHRRSKFSGGQFEKNALLRILKAGNFDEDFSVCSEAIEKNRRWAQQKNLRGCDFDEIACIDILLGDDTVISCPQRIDFDVTAHSYKIVGPYTELDDLTKDGVSKFHMPPELASAVIENILTQKEAAQARMRRAKK